MVFNQIIESLQSKNDCGFNLNEEKIITLPYADDFLPDNNRSEKTSKNSK